MSRKILTNIFVVIFSLLALVSGVPKLLPIQFLVDLMASLGYGISFTRFLGVCWIAAGIGVWNKKLRSLAVLLMMPILAGAIASHWTAGLGLNYAILVFVVAGLLVLYFDDFFFRVSKN